MKTDSLLMQGRLQLDLPTPSAKETGLKKCTGGLCFSKSKDTFQASRFLTAGDTPNNLPFH